MGSIYFDITDIVAHAASHTRVSGIQRVQLRLVANLVKAHGPKTIKGMAYLGDEKGWRDIDLSFLTGQTEFDATQILIHAGALTPSFLPDRHQVKKYLRPFDRHKLLRTVKKLELYGRALIAPDSLSRHGIHHTPRRIGRAMPQATTELKPLDPADIYVVLGANWAIAQTDSMAQAHRAQGGRVVQMVYDLIPHTHPEYHTAQLVAEYCGWLKRASRCTSTFLCISENTARHLKDFLLSQDVSAEVVVTSLAHEFSGFARNHQSSPAKGSRLAEILQGRPYVLCVGTLEIRKNGLGLARAWQKVHGALGDATPLLVFAGTRGWRIEQFEEFLDTTDHVSQTVKIIPSPSDAELAALYSQCLFTVYPSLYEGWGLPVGESAWFGKYGVVSSASSLPEVCGEWVDYMVPDDIDDMAHKILRPLRDRIYLAGKHAAIAAAPLRTWADVSAAVFNCIGEQQLQHDPQPRTQPSYRNRAGVEQQPLGPASVADPRESLR